MTKDMTAGTPARHLLEFTIPLIFGNLFQQVYSMADAVIVGRFLGTDSLAAVGSTGPLTFFIFGFCLGLCSGFAIPVAQSFGAKNQGELRQYVGNIVWLSLGFSLVITAITMCLCRQMLVMMNTPPDILEESHRYLMVILAGIPTTVAYNTMACLLRALGDSRTPVVFLLVASVINVVLDFVFIVFTPLGVMGAAAATVVAQALSGVACFVFIVKRFPPLHIGRGDLTPRGNLMKRLCGMGIPMGLQSSITAIGSILLQAAVNGLGSLAVASMTAAGKLNQLFTCFYDSLGIAMSTYGGQNVGARKIGRLNPGLRSGMLIGGCYAVLALLAGLLFGRSLLCLFVDAGEAQIIASAYQLLITNLAFHIPLAAVNVFRLLIQGMGYSRLAIFAGVFELVARGFTGVFLVPAFGFTAACFASPIAWVLADLFLVPAYFVVRRKLEPLRID